MYIRIRIHTYININMHTCMDWILLVSINETHELDTGHQQQESAKAVSSQP